MGDQPGGQTITTIERAADVLTLFTKVDTTTLGVTEIAQELGLSKGVVHRILTSLRHKGFVEVDDNTRRYSLGPATLALGLTRLQRVEVRDLARPVLRELSQKMDETATLSIRTGWQRMYVEQVTPQHEVIMTVQLGHPYPLHAGSSSKALLAFLPGAEQEQYMVGDLAQLTPGTITDPQRLRAELDAIAARGYATSVGERQDGAASVAAPIFDHEGAPAASMSLCGPAERFQAKTEEAASLVLDATGRLSRQLGHGL